MAVRAASTGRTLFGGRLLTAREHAGLTQVEAAKRVGMSQGTLGGLECQGKGSSYTPVLAELYRVSPIWLATGKGSMLSGDVKESGSQQSELSPEKVAWLEAFDYIDNEMKALVLGHAQLNRLAGHKGDPKATKPMSNRKP